MTAGLGTDPCNPSPDSAVGGIAVETPSGKVPSHAVGETSVQVFEYGAGIVTDACQQLGGAPLLASGTAFFSQTINNIAGPGNGPGSFVVQITVHGILDLTTGGQARVHGAARFEIRPDGTVVKDQEPVTLKPL